MLTPEQCRENAADAERLAALVSYERDRVRLTRQAAEWLARADALEAAGPPAQAIEIEAPRPTWLARVFRRGGG